VQNINAHFELEPFCGQCHIADSGVFIEKCINLYSLLTAANQKVNLTKIEDEPAFWDRHIADSIAIARFFPKLATDSLILADIGCGAGFPAIPLALAFPKLKITAIDSIAKKTRFVELAAEKLEICNLEAVTARSRELPHRPGWRERFDIVSARAVADARTLFRENRQLLKKRGKFIFYKTPDQIAAEIEEVRKASEKYGLNWLTTPVFELPGGSGRRQFLFA
jgi:16S rRNA (guanine527-N7)-methyltransferase